MDNFSSKDNKFRDQNNFGFLRLLFAILVTLSHSSELIDGNRSREILASIFGSVTFGEISVDGFFLISGYLITKSFLQTKTIRKYLFKRVLRIYPGYIVALLICYFVIGPFVGGRFTGVDPLVFIGHLITLQPPDLPGAFAGLPYPHLDGSMWTLSYEFRCYLLVILLGYFGGRRIFTIFAVILIVSMCIPVSFSSPSYSLLGYPHDDIRFGGFFFVGSLFYLWRDKIIYRGRYAALALVALCPLMFTQIFVHPALAILGGYILFWFALHVKTHFLSRIGSKMDISYGIYLYSWPIQNIIIMHWRDISPWVLFVIAILLAASTASVSWICVERPFLGLKKTIKP